MARIPLQIASRSLDTGSVVQYPSSSPVGAALAGVGDALQGASSRLMQQQERALELKERKDGFTAKIKEQEFSSYLAGLEQDAVQNSPADASGLHDSVYGELDPVTNQAVKPGSFDKLFDTYLEQIPESQREDFAAKRELYRQQGSVRLGQAQYEGEQRYYNVEIQKAQNQITTAMAEADPNDTETFAGFKQQGLDIIDKSGLPALEKDVARTNWLAKADEALFQSKLAKDPEFARGARAALGLAAPSAAGPEGGGFEAAIVNRESGGRPGIVNEWGFAGLFQFGAPRLADIGVYDPQGENLGGWSQRKGSQGKWTGEFKIPGFPEVRKLADFLANPEAQKAAFAIHRAKMDQEAERLGLTDYIGQTVGGVEITRDGLHAMMHLGGAGNAKKALKSGGADNASDANGSSVLAYAKMAAGGGGNTKPAAQVKFIDATQGKIRDKPIQGWVRDGLAQAAAATDPRIAIKVVSGGQDGARRTGSNRHDHGNAADIILVVDGKEVRPSENKALYAKFFRNAAASGFKGLGHYEWGIHIGGGAQAVWGPDKTSATLDPEFAKAAAEGWDNPASAGTSLQADPSFANIPLDRRLALANQADVQVGEIQRSEAATQKLAYTQHKDAVELSIVQRGIKDESLISNDGILNDGDKATLIRSLREQNSKTAQLDADMSAFTDGSLTLDPYDAKHKNRADDLFTELASRAPPEQAGAVAGEIIRATGVVPQPAMNAIRRGLASQDPAEVAAAAQTAQRISGLDPAALSRRDGGAEVQKAADDFNFRVNNLNLTPEEAARQHIDASDPQKQRDRKALEPAAKAFQKEIEQENLPSLFDDAWFSDPQVGFAPGSEYGIKAEFQALADDAFYKNHGNAELARNDAIQQMKRLYGVTRMGSRPTVMKHPPELHWPKQTFEGIVGGMVGDPLQYAKTQLQADVAEFAGEGFVPGSIALVTTPETDAAVKRGEIPGYAVMWRDDHGNYQTLPGQLWRPDVSMIQRQESMRQERQQTERVERARSDDDMARRISEGVPRVLKGSGMQNSPLMQVEPQAPETLKSRLDERQDKLFENAPQVDPMGNAF